MLKQLALKTVAADLIRLTAELIRDKIAASKMKQRGVERRIVIGAPVDEPGRHDPRLVSALSMGLRFWEQEKDTNALTARDFAKQEGVDNRYIGRVLPLAFLAPNIVERFVAGRQPPEWTAERVIHLERLPHSWEEQRRLFGLP